MSGPEKSPDEKAEETRKQAEAVGKVTLDTSKSFITWMLGLWAKFTIGCLILAILVFVGGCVVLTQLF
jgi:uncharacterized membrane protein